MKLCVNVGLAISFFSLVGCGPSLSDEDVAKAKSLMMSNILCEVMVNYRVGSVSVLAMNGKYHRSLGDQIAGAIDYDFAQMRKKMDAAFEDDLQKILNNAPRDEYEYHVQKMFYGLQDILKSEYGYSYPDCDMVLSMSEAFTSHDRM